MLRPDDRGGAIEPPCRGTELKVSLGYRDSSATVTGTYVVDEIGLASPADAGSAGQGDRHVQGAGTPRDALLGRRDAAHPRRPERDRPRLGEACRQFPLHGAHPARRPDRGVGPTPAHPARAGHTTPWRSRPGENFRDGLVASLQKQPGGPVENPLEMAFTNDGAVDRLSEAPVEEERSLGPDSHPAYMARTVAPLPAPSPRKRV